MSRYQKLFAIVIILAIAAGVVAYLMPISRGLDIAGGIRVVMQVNPSRNSDWPGKPSQLNDRREKMDSIAKTLRERVKGFSGVTEPVVRVEDANASKPRVIVELPGVKDPEKAVEQIKSTASLDFYYLKNVQTPENPIADWKMEVAPGDEKSYIFTGPKGETLNSSIKADAPKILTDVVGVSKTQNGSGVKPILTGADLYSNAKSNLDQTNGVIINIEFNQKGTNVFRDFTGNHIGEILAVFYDGKLLTAPTIKDKINDGKAQISGFTSLKEAKQVADFLNAGALPVPLKVIAKDTVEPSLGQHTIGQVVWAGILGLALVLLFMAFYYRLPGLLADVALGLYALFTIAVFKAFHVSMSLAGIAALIISIGMAVDANILIFERLKEELRSGKTLRAAIDAGFNRAFTAIFDSNVCTAITCGILMGFGTPSVQSFAFTLLVGVAISMFTAITVTRTFLHLLVNWEWAQNPALYGLSTGWASAGLNWDIVGKRMYYFLLSFILVVPGVIILITSGLKPGIEFMSGTTLQATFKKPVSLTDVRNTVNQITEGSDVQMAEHGKMAFITTRLLSENKNFDAKVEQLRSSLDSKYGLTTMNKNGQPTFASVSSVGPTISKELTTNAVRAVLFACIAIVLYLTFRFAIGGLLTGLKYGTCAVIALIHDAFFILGGFAILGKFAGWETDSLFVTAVLTIIGFSVHDTIVVFDRIRENLRNRQRGESFEQLANRSILQTLSRSINTSFTVVLTLAMLTVFGGPLLRHFYITLMAGIIIGTYSSIFNATPLVIVWDKLAERGKAPARKAFEDKPLVEKPLLSTAMDAPANGNGKTDVMISDAGTKTPEAQAAKAARIKRKKKRF